MYERRTFTLCSHAPQNSCLIWVFLSSFQKQYVQSIGIPSQSELDRLQNEDKERIVKRLETLGPDGLRRKGEELAAAITYNSRPLPESIINSVPIATLNNTKFHDVKIYRTDGTDDELPSGLVINSWPIYAEAYDCRTKFVYVSRVAWTHLKAS